MSGAETDKKSGLARPTSREPAHSLPPGRSATRGGFMCKTWATRAGRSAPRSLPTYNMAPECFRHGLEGLRAWGDSPAKKVERQRRMEVRWYRGAAETSGCLRHHQRRWPRWSGHSPGAFVDVWHTSARMVSAVDAKLVEEVSVISTTR